MLGLYNPPRRGCGKPAKPGLSYPLVWMLVFLSHRIICKRTYANCSLHPRVFQGIKSTGKQ
jgi:hypothetical protein